MKFIWQSTLIILAIIIVAAGECSAQSKSEADKKVIVTTKRDQDHLDVFVENKNPFDITLTIEISGSNYRTSRITPLQRVFRSNSTIQLLQVYVVDKNKSINIYTDYSWFAGDIHARHNDSYVYALPFRRGESYRIGQGYDGTFSHQGRSRYAVDFVMPEGTPVYAARGGTVIQTQAGFSRGGPSKNYAERSNFIVIMHNDGTIGEYAHLKKNGVFVKTDDRISKGQRIGLSGNTGFSSGPHLHFMVSKVREDGISQSLPFKFRTAEGIVENPKMGKFYTAN